LHLLHVMASLSWSFSSELWEPSGSFSGMIRLAFLFFSPVSHAASPSSCDTEGCIPFSMDGFFLDERRLVDDGTDPFSLRRPLRALLCFSSRHLPSRRVRLFRVWLISSPSGRQGFSLLSRHFSTHSAAESPPPSAPPERRYLR